MFYRISLGYPHDRIPPLVEEELSSPVTEWVDKDQFVPLHALGPHSPIPVVLHTNSTDEGGLNRVATSRSVLRTMKWGVVFEGSESEQVQGLNCEVRGRTLLSRNAKWGVVKRTKRCAVVCQGFFLHLRPAQGKRKIPYFVRFKDKRMMFLAGLYDQCTTLQGHPGPLFSFAVVTTDAIQPMEWLSDRVPVILATDRDIRAWLDIANGTWPAGCLGLLTSSHNNDARELEW